MIDFKKYTIVFLITAFVFFTAITLSNRLNDKRLEELHSIQNKIAIDILSSETQFTLLSESSCKDAESSVLSEEIDSLGNKLSFTEEKLGEDNTEVIDLKRYYSLLEVKDYLLMKRVESKCNTKPIFILYFYSNKGDCTECTKEGYVLSNMREKYPQLRVYSFDYNLDLSTLQTLKTIYKLEDKLPALVVNDKTLYGFKSIEDIETLVPELKLMLATTTATSTKK